MPDLFGLLPLPAPVPERGKALADPALDVVLSFLKAVLNADLGDAWASRCPTDPLPVAFTFAHEPKLYGFNDDETPALYLWRPDDAGAQQRYSQDHVADESGFVGLWVPPRLQQEDDRFLASFWNGLKKSMQAAFSRGRHPAWVVEGDDYYHPEEYGSVLVRHAGLLQVRLGQFRHFVLPIASEDHSFKQEYDAILFTVPATELLKPDPAADGVLHASNRGVVELPERGALLERLDAVMPGETLTYNLDFSVDTPLDPATGPAAGGTVVTLSGTQFIEGMIVRFGEVEAEVEYVDESTIFVTTPAHVAGVVDITVEQQPDGAFETLVGAFTFV